MKNIKILNDDVIALTQHHHVGILIKNKNDSTEIIFPVQYLDKIITTLNDIKKQLNITSE